jgi:hypothetical protein
MQQCRDRETLKKKPCFSFIWEENPNDDVSSFLVRKRWAASKASLEKEKENAIDEDDIK